MTNKDIIRRWLLILGTGDILVSVLFFIWSVASSTHPMLGVFLTGVILLISYLLLSDNTATHNDDGDWPLIG